jgi:hypothetical protein
MSWRERAAEVEKAVATPLMLLLPTLILIIVGSVLAWRGPDHYSKLIVFGAICLVVYHLTFWLCRKETTDRALKVVDYIFLGLGFVGVFGALDVQANVYRSKIPDVLARYRPSVDEAYPCNRDSRRSKNCHWPEVVKIVLSRPYNHILLGMQFDKERVESAYPNGMTDQDKEFFDAVRSLYDAMQDEVYQYVDPIEVFDINHKIFAYYILCVGLSLRLTKVSAEVFGWHLPKGAPPVAVLPTTGLDDHNGSNRKQAEGDVQEGSNAGGGQAIQEGQER